jgi:VWFA-related protein
MNVRQVPSVLVCCLTLSLCPLVAAQQPKEAPTHDDKFTLKSDVNVVLVPVLVRDKQGHEVGTLKKEDFQVFENGKPQIISGFTIEKRPPVETNTKVADPAPVVPGVAPQPAETIPGRLIVFMFDDMHLSAEDLIRTQKAAEKMLAGSLTDSDMAAVVSTSGRTNSGLTRDRAKVQEALRKLQPQGLYRTSGSECPDIGYYQGDLIQNKHDSNALESAIQQVFSCMPNLNNRNAAERIAESAAMQAVTIGEQDVRVTLSSIHEFLRRMAGLPGQRTLVLVSPGFLNISAEARDAESQIMDMAAQSNVTISALDARGLYTTEFDASERGTGSAFTMQLKADYHRNSMSINEDVMAELADATGGTYFHNNNDLQAGLSRLAAGPEYLYLLYVSPSNIKQDGTYHRLKVKVDQDGLKLQARQGYFAPKPSKKKQESKH